MRGEFLVYKTRLYRVVSMNLMEVNVQGQANGAWRTDSYNRQYVDDSGRR